MGGVNNKGVSSTGTITPGHLAEFVNASVIEDSGIPISGVSPGGTPTQIQYNNSGVFGGVGNSSVDGTGKLLGLGGSSPTVTLEVAGTSTPLAAPATLHATLIAESLISSPSGSASLLYGPQDTNSSSANESPGGSIYTANGQTLNYTIQAYLTIGSIKFLSPGSGSAQCSMTDGYNDGSNFVVGVSWAGSTCGDGSAVSGYIVSGPFGQIDVNTSTSYTDDGTSQSLSGSYQGFGGITASGQSFDFQPFNIATDPGGALYSSPQGSDYLVTEGFNNGSQFWVVHTLSGLAGSFTLVYEFNENGYFTTGSSPYNQTSTIGGGTNPYPAHYGIQANGTNLNQAFQAYSKQVRPLLYSIAHADAATVDPADSNYYYITLVLSDFGGSGSQVRILQNVNSAGFNDYHDTTSLTTTYTALSGTWTSGSTVTPNVLPAAAIIAQNNSAALDQPPQIICQSTDPTYPNASIAFADLAGDFIGILGVNPNTGNIRLLSASAAGFEISNSRTGTPYSVAGPGYLTLNNQLGNYYALTIKNADGTNFLYAETTNNLIRWGGTASYGSGNIFHQIKSPSGFTGLYVEMTSTGDSPIVINNSVGTQVFSISSFGKTFTQASTSNAASLNIPSGSVPSSPSNGDIWQNSNHLYVELNGTTYQLDQQPGNVTSVSNSNGSLTISPTTGAVVASINLGHANTFTANQTAPKWITTGGSSSQFVKGDGTLDSSSYFVLPSLTNGSVLFSNGTTISQDNSNFFWDNTNKRLSIGKSGVAPVQPLDIGGPMQFTGVPVASAPTAALAGLGSGNLQPGAYTYRVSFVTAIGETVPTNSSNTITVVSSSTNGQIALTNIPTSTNPYVIGRNIYRIDPTIPNGIYYKITSGTTIGNNTATTYTDNVANSFVSTLNYGNVLSDSSATGIFVSGSAFVHFRGNQNLWIGAAGLPAGNTTVTNLSSLNVGIGASVMGNITTGGSNVSVGVNNTAGSITSGSLHTLIGSACGTALTTQSEDTFIGQYSGRNSTGNYNTFAGSYSGLNLVGGDMNVAVGRGTLGNAASGSNNTALGAGAGGAGTNGQTNWNNMLFIGYNAAANLLANNISNITVIGGNSIYAASATASNTLNIMNAIYGTSLDGTAGTLSTGNIGIGIKAPSARHHVQGGTAATVVQITQGASSQIGDLQEWQNSSNNILAKISSSGVLTLGLASSQTGTINFNGTTSGTVTVNPAAAAGTWTMTLPTGAGSSGQHLITDGTGITSWSNVLPTVTTVSLTGQTSDIASTNFTGANVAGLYRVHYSLEDTASDVTAGAVTLSITYTAAAGVISIPSAAQVLTGTGLTQGTVFVQLSSGSIAYSTSHTGLFGSAQYAVYMTVERLK